MWGAVGDTGRRLRELDCDDFAQFFRKFLDDKQPKASAFVFVLWRHLPAFCDGNCVFDMILLSPPAGEESQMVSLFFFQLVKK